MIKKKPDISLSLYFILMYLLQIFSFRKKLNDIFTATSVFLLKCFTPSVIIVLQKGHPVAITLGSKDKASSVLSMLISLFPFSGSLNICAPPAPQQRPFVLQRFISTSSASSFSSKILGASYSSFARPR